MNASLLLCSGGLDSTTLAYFLREQRADVLPVFIDYGQHCALKEWQTLNTVLPAEYIASLERLRVGDIFRGCRSRLITEADLWREDVRDDDLYLPYRTLLFFAIAASFAQSRGLTDVFSGFINSNHAKEVDCSAVFFNSLESFTEQVGPVRFHMPFRQWSKHEVVAEAKRLAVPIGATYSCQMFSDTPCGACPNCVDRLQALKENRS
jgi:7-cyano-7-deazaguanine synthase